MISWRVIDASTCSSSGGVKSSPARTQKNDAVGHSSTLPCGLTNRASSKPRSLASRPASMLAA